MDYKLPYDVTLDVELNVYCNMLGPGGTLVLRSVEMSGFEILDILKKGPGNVTDDIIGKWLMFYHGNAGAEFHKIGAKLKFEVTFSGKGEIDNVAINCVGINDIVSPEMEQELINEAEKMGGEF